ncbi:MAG: alpha/beta hydrolase fold domain-containing protein [Alphaproteobacteria bacterium]|nr:alpha/beta hydrolase fold domain-containing protein [Alphaproteobacteria bacterium]
MSSDQVDTEDSLDPESQAFLDEVAAADAPALEDQTLSESRAGMRQLLLATALPVADSVAITDRTVPEFDERFKLRLYHPEGTQQRPALIFLHGGGWVLADPACYDGLVATLCEQVNCVGISVDYRLAPEHKFPAALEDCDEALDWVVSNAAALNIDPTRCILAGDSAGANLAAALCLRRRDREQMLPQGLALLYPMLSLDDDPPFHSRSRYGNGHYFISRDSIAWSVAHYVNGPADTENLYAAPSAATDLLGFPSTLVLTAGHDPLRDEGRVFAERLEAAGVNVNFRCFNSTIHGFMSFLATAPVGRAAISYTADWLSAHFGRGRGE